MKNWDVFLSYAAEDTAAALPLAAGLRAAGLRVWLDHAQIQLGDSIVARIEEGLTHSRFGVVILSPSFLNKPWQKRELGALLAREEFGRKVIIPVYHGIDRTTLIRVSPTLADRCAGNTDWGVPSLVQAIASIVLEEQADSSETPTLTRRFIELLDSCDDAIVIRDFLGHHPRIVRAALGGAGDTSVRDGLDRDELYVEWFISTERTSMVTLILLSSTLAPFDPETGDINQSVLSSTARVGAQLAHYRTESPSGYYRGVVVTGRRNRLTDSARKAIERFNRGRRSVPETEPVLIRSYDWLIDASIPQVDQGESRTRKRGPDDSE